jgi:predicted nucleic acid-binding protein
MTNDSLILASALKRGVDQLASADSDFNSIKEIKAYRPGDIVGLQAS